MNENTIRKIVALYIKDYYNSLNVIVFFDNDKIADCPQFCDEFDTIRGYVHVPVNNRIKIQPFIVRLNGSAGFQVEFNNL